MAPRIQEVEDIDVRCVQDAGRDEEGDRVPWWDHLVHGLGVRAGIANVSEDKSAKSSRRRERAQRRMEEGRGQEGLVLPLPRTQTQVPRVQAPTHGTGQGFRARESGTQAPRTLSARLRANAEQGAS